MADELYDQDFYLWTKAKADALRKRSANELDYDLLAEEIEDMGERDFRECASRIRVILEHLWKLSAETRPEPRGGWKATILKQRAELEDALTPSMRAMIQNHLEKLHGDAHKLAILAFESNEPTALPLDASLRWSLSQVLGEEDGPLWI